MFFKIRENHLHIGAIRRQRNLAGNLLRNQKEIEGPLLCLSNQLGILPPGKIKSFSSSLVKLLLVTIHQQFSKSIIYYQIKFIKNKTKTLFNNMFELEEVNDVHFIALNILKFGGSPLISCRRLQ